jgi:hypothetical protein
MSMAVSIEGQKAITISSGDHHLTIRCGQASIVLTAAILLQLEKET